MWNSMNQKSSPLIPELETQTLSEQCMCAQLCPNLCDPMDGSLPGSSVHGDFQAIILEWVAISFSRGSFQPRDGTHTSCISCTAGGFFTHWATWEAHRERKGETKGKRKINRPLQMLCPGVDKMSNNKYGRTKFPKLPFAPHCWLRFIEVDSAHTNTTSLFHLCNKSSDWSSKRCAPNNKGWFESRKRKLNDHP